MLGLLARACGGPRQSQDCGGLMGTRVFLEGLTGRGRKDLCFGGTVLQGLMGEF